MPFGFKMPKGQLDGASFADKLAAFGAAAQGDYSLGADIAQKVERERLTQEVARMFGGAMPGAELQPQPAPEPAPQEAPPAQVAAADVARSLQGASMGEAPNLPMMTERARITPPQADLGDLPMKGGQPEGAPSTSAYRTLLPRLIQAMGKGVDPSGLASLLKSEDYISTLPQKDQARARLDPKQIMEWDHADGLPLINETSPGATMTRTDRRSGETTPVYTSPARPEPITADRIIGRVLDKAQQGQALTPAEQKIYDRWENGTDGEGGAAKPPSTSQVVAGVLGQVEKGGIDSLTPGQKAIWDRYNRDSNPFAALMGADGLGGDDEGVPDDLPRRGAQPTPRRGGGAAPKAAPAQPPAAALSQLQEGRQTTFANGQVWTKRGGKAVYVGTAK